MLTSGPVVLTLSDVSKSFDGTLAVRVDLMDAAAAETLVLIGASGSGKSPRIRLMVGRPSPNSGTVTLEGTAVARPRRSIRGAAGAA